MRTQRHQRKEQSTVSRGGTDKGIPGFEALDQAPAGLHASEVRPSAPAQVAIDTYHQYMCEALHSLRSGLESKEQADELIGQGDTLGAYSWGVESGMRCRYAFLLAANALEAAANALLLSLDASRGVFEAAERLETLLKFELVCMARGKRLDRGNVLFAKLTEIVRCRNQFVHPKPNKVSILPTADGAEFEPDVPKTKTSGYPKSFGLFLPAHAQSAIGDILGFVAWVTFDILGLGLEEGSMHLGYGSCGSTADVTLLALEHGFDMRSFGEDARRVERRRTSRRTRPVPQPEHASTPANPLQ